MTAAKPASTVTTGRPKTNAFPDREVLQLPVMNCNHDTKSRNGDSRTETKYDSSPEPRPKESSSRNRRRKARNGAVSTCQNDRDSNPGSRRDLMVLAVWKNCSSCLFQRLLARRALRPRACLFFRGQYPNAFGRLLPAKDLESRNT